MFKLSDDLANFSWLQCPRKSMYAAHVTDKNDEYLHYQIS